MKVIVILPLMSLANAAQVYPMVNEIDATCESSGYAKMDTQEECFDAAAAMGLEPKFATSNVPRPLGCYRKGTRVYYGLPPNTGGAQSDRKPLCKTDSPAFPWIYEDGETCESSGFSLLSVEECWTAAENQGLVKGWTTNNPDRPEGCYRKGYKAFYGMPAATSGNGAQAGNGRHPICSPEPSDPDVVTEVPEFSFADGGHCDGTVVFTDNDSTLSNKDQCAIQCKALGTEFFGSCEACGQPACRCCDAINTASGAGGWSQYKFESEEPVIEVPEFEYADNGFCQGTVVETDSDSGLSNTEQCAIECKALGAEFFGSCDDCSQHACRCCDAINADSGAGGWLQFRFVALGFEAVFKDVGFCPGTVVHTDEALGTSNKEQCLAECASQGKPYFSNCEACGQPACRCCDEINPDSVAGGWLQYSIEVVSTLPAPVRRRQHAEDSEEDAIDMDDE